MEVTITESIIHGDDHEDDIDFVSKSRCTLRDSYSPNQFKKKRTFFIQRKISYSFKKE